MNDFHFPLAHHPYKTRKAFHRKCVAFLFCTVGVVHYFHPDHEWWVTMATNVVWLFDPMEA